MWFRKQAVYFLLLVGPSFLASCGSFEAQPGIPAILFFQELLSVLNPSNQGVTIAHSGSGGSVTEGGATDTYTVVLNQAPTQNVTIEALPDAQLLVNSASTATALTFTTNDWNIPQTLTVAAVDDTVAEGNHTGAVSHSVTQGDDIYLALTLSDLSFSITDNDTAGVSITESGGAVNVTEGTVTDTYDIVLTSAPTADVVITINPDSQSTTDLPSVTFTTLNWDTPQTITVTPVDDSLAEGAHISTISHAASSSDANYNGIAINDVVANITDNETDGVSITESGGSTDIVEGGATDSYDVVLTALPSATVTVTITTDSQANADKATLTFLTSNWDTAQTVTLTAVDDDIAEGAHSSTVTHTAASSDLSYDGITISDVVASITDNDTAAVNITESGGSTDVEEGDSVTGDTYTISLATTPAGSVDVDIDVAFDTAQVTVNGKSASPETVTLNSGNSWSATVTVKAVDDSTCEQNHTSILTHTAISTDPVYNGITPISDVTVNIADVARVKYMETGEVSMVGSATANVGLGQSVTVGNSILFCNFNTSDSSAVSWPTCRLNSSSQIDIRTGAAIDTNVRYHLVEFKTGVNVQRGNVTWDTVTTQTSPDITISSVDTGSAFVLVTARTTGTSTLYDERVTVTGELSSSTTLHLQRNEAGTAIDIEWQVVEIEAASVQSGTTQIAGGASTKNVSVTTVDPATSFLVFNYRGASASNGEERLYKTRGILNGAGDTLIFNRTSTTNTVDVAWYLITMTDGATVQSGTETFTGTAVEPPSNISRTAAITSVDTTSSIPVISSSGGGASTPDSDLDVTSFSGYLSSATGLQLDRLADQNITSYVDWFVVTFLQ